MVVDVDCWGLASIDLVPGGQVSQHFVLLWVDIFMVLELINAHGWVGDSFVLLLYSSHELSLPRLALGSQSQVVPSSLVGISHIEINIVNAFSIDFVMLAVSIVNKLIIMTFWHILEF